MLTLFPATLILHHTAWSDLRAAVASQPAILQFFEIMLTDLFQYWNSPAVSSGSRPCGDSTPSITPRVAMDWMASAGMHILEIVALRGFTVIPMQVLGFQVGPMQAYILAVYISSTFIHANVHWKSPRWLSWLLVTPRFHHWHHGAEREAIDVNFAVHFSILDRIFGTYHMPQTPMAAKPTALKGTPSRRSYLAQFLYPFRRRNNS